MRAVVCWAVLALALLCACPLAAQDTAEPAPEATPAIPPGASVPDATVPTQPVVPTSPADIQHGPLVAPPPGLVPSPVAPSEEPSGFVPEPEPPVADITGDFIEISADSVRTTSEAGRALRTVAVGDVTARYRDVIATANRAEVDYSTNIAVFEGNVVFRQGIQEARGERVTLDLRTRQWTGLNASTAIEPEYAQGWLAAPVFVDAGSLSGHDRRQIDAHAVEATTCNLDNPHYELVSKSLTVYPNNKLILRRVSAYILDRKLFTIPRFVVPLREIQRNPRLIPRVGQSEEEGYFLKTAYSYLGDRAQAGFLLLDLMSRKGFGKGIEHSWRLPTATGEARFYHVFDRNIQQDTLTGRMNHTQRLGTVVANIGSDFRSNSYLYAPASKTLVNRFTLTRDRPGASSSFAVTQNVNNAFTRTSNLSAFLKHRQLFGTNTSLDTDLDYTGFRSNGTRARLSSNMLFTQRQPKFDWTISAQDLADLSDEAFAGQGVFAGIEKLPEIGLVTDTTRLGRLLPFGVPARLRVTNGHYVELPADTSLNRTFFEFLTPIQRYSLSDTWRFGVGAGFRQYFYSDDTAQYSIDASSELSKRLGPTSSFDLNYRLQKPKGFSPFRFDYIGRYNIATASVNYQDSERVRFSLLTGYNFDQPLFPWQDVTFRFALQPNSSLLLYTATGYDLNRYEWRTLINELRIRAGDRFRLDLGTRYDTIREELAVGRLILDAVVDSKTRLQAVTSYNGFTNQFDYSSVMLTRDLHCWEASLVYTRQTGFYESQGITLNLRIKAFPFFRDFGAGQFGQALGPSVGQVY